MKTKKILFGVLSIVCFGFTTLSTTSCDVINDVVGEVVDEVFGNLLGDIQDKEELKYRLLLDRSGYAITGVSSSVDTRINIPSSYKGKLVKKIDSKAFKNCSALTSVTIPDSVVEIGRKAFAGCSSLETIVISNNIEEIGENVFENCTNLSNVSTPMKAVSYIPKENLETVVITSGEIVEGFSGCTSLESVTIPDSIISIGNAAFVDCDSLTSITLPNSVTSIGNYAFQGCSSLENITISNSVKSIGAQAFYCEKLKNVYYTGTEEQWNLISINDGNEYLTNATIIYNYNG